MNKNPSKIIWQVFFLFGVMVFVFGCASNKTWYKSGQGQIDFDLDHQECQRIAREMGRQATITGEKINIDVFNKSYHNCLFSRGWTNTAPGDAKTKLKAVELAKIKGSEIHVFDRIMTLPAGFSLVSNYISGFEDIKQQTLFFQGQGPVFFNMIIQEAVSRKFDPIDYPVKDPFFIFEKGKEKNKKLRVNWTVFSGDFKGDWVTGIGAYYLMDKKKRVSIVMTRAIPSQETSPPEGLRLTKIQKQAVEDFSLQWLEKIQQAFLKKE